MYFSSSTQALTPETAESEIAAKRPGHVERRRAPFGSRLPWLSPGLPQSLRSSSTVVSGRVRLARSDVDRVSGTGACCRRAGDWVRCVRLPFVESRVA